MYMHKDNNIFQDPIHNIIFNEKRPYLCLLPPELDTIFKADMHK